MSHYHHLREYQFQDLLARGVGQVVQLPVLDRRPILPDEPFEMTVPYTLLNVELERLEKHQRTGQRRARFRFTLNGYSVRHVVLWETGAACAVIADLNRVIHNMIEQEYGVEVGA